MAVGRLCGAALRSLRSAEFRSGWSRDPYHGVRRGFEACLTVSRADWLVVVGVHERSGMRRLPAPQAVRPSPAAVGARRVRGRACRRARVADRAAVRQTRRVRTHGECPGVGWGGAAVRSCGGTPRGRHPGTSPPPDARREGVPRTRTSPARKPYRNGHRTPHRSSAGFRPSECRRRVRPPPARHRGGIAPTSARPRGATRPRTGPSPRASSNRHGSRLVAVAARRGARRRLPRAAPWRAATDAPFRSLALVTEVLLTACCRSSSSPTIRLPPAPTEMAEHGPQSYADAVAPRAVLCSPGTSASYLPGICVR
jgi:hypothetical protein